MSLKLNAENLVFRFLRSLLERSIVLRAIDALKREPCPGVLPIQQMLSRLVEFGLPFLPVRQQATKQFIEPLAMVVLLEMAELVEYHIVRARAGGLDQVRIEEKLALTGTFTPGFGVSIADAVQASCSAYPFFERKVVTTAAGDKVELIDGGYCANNPTLYAIADAVAALKKERSDLRVVSVGVGVYPDPKPGLLMSLAKRYLVSVQLLQKTLEINTQSMEQLRSILFKDVQTIRISDTFEKPDMATDLMEHNLEKLNLLRQRGSESFASREADLKKYLM